MYSNHSWVSFQGFCESYNDAFDLPSELGNDTLLLLISAAKLIYRYIIIIIG